MELSDDPISLHLFPVLLSKSSGPGSYFGPERLFRRHEYTVDVLGNAPGLNYASDYRNVAGVMVPTKRRVFDCDGEKLKIPEPLIVAIDIPEIEFR
jgi:hypothetical protein